MGAENFGHYFGVVVFEVLPVGERGLSPDNLRAGRGGKKISKFMPGIVSMLLLFDAVFASGLEPSSSPVEGFGLPLPTDP